jgi:sensor c-di-GMP phosphodiesterase-like protein
VNRRNLPLALSSSYVILVCIVLMVIGYQLRVIHSIEAEVNDAIESINITVSYLWIIGIVILIIVFILYFSTKKP